MRLFELPYVPLDKADVGDPKQWTFEGMVDLDERLKRCKSRLDPIYSGKDSRRFEAMSTHFEPSAVIKSKVITGAKPQLVSNAWLKLVEMICGLQLMQPGETIRMADFCSAPGSFIMAANYAATTLMSPPVKLDWMASTLISADAKEALGDTYKLMKYHPDRFMTTGTKFNGDTTDASYLSYLRANRDLASSFNLFTSDFGCFVPKDKYNYQEAIGARGNLGQITAGLILLRPGGMLVTKQFTHMSSFTISLMAIVAGLFKEVYVVKPITSKPDNSEEYLVGRGYAGADVSVNVIDLMLKRLANWTVAIEDRNFTAPMIAGKHLPSDFVRAILRMTNALVETQCQKIDANIAEFKRMIRDNSNRPSKEFVEMHVSPGVAVWEQSVPMKVMNQRDWLRAATAEEVAKLSCTRR